MIISKLIASQDQDSNDYKIKDLYGNVLTLPEENNLEVSKDTPFLNPQFRSIESDGSLVNITSSYYVLSGEFTIGFWIKFPNSATHLDQNNSFFLLVMKMPI